MTRHETMQPWQKAGEAFIESMQESIKEICYLQGRNTQEQLQFNIDVIRRTCFNVRRFSYSERDIQTAGDN